jgi:predicted ribosome quality control (RQC) complex YloA/Tae2 family protein
MVAQKAEVAKTAERENLRQCGDIIMANLHNMKRGQKVLTAQDFYSSDGKKRSIVLDVLKAPEQNASMYYKRYKKAKTAQIHLLEQIEYGEKELEYLESVLEAILLAEGESDIKEIRRELMSAGYLKEQRVKNTGASKNRKAQSRKQGTKKAEAPPMKFTSSSGMRILAGKNNVQNDRLTLRTANKSDMWLHAQKIYGSHVVISCADGVPDETTLFEAATIAAYYSSARDGGKVLVDYTLVKYVKKPSGGRPGMVIYTEYKTIMVVPDEELVNRLRG